MIPGMFSAVATQDWFSLYIYVWWPRIDQNLADLLFIEYSALNLSYNRIEHSIAKAIFNNLPPKI